MTIEADSQNKVWIETDIMGGRTVMFDYGLPNLKPIRYCTFHYTAPISSNSGTLAAAEKLARTLGAGSTVKNVNIGAGSHQASIDLYNENESLKKILGDVLERFGNKISEVDSDLSERIQAASNN